MKMIHIYCINYKLFGWAFMYIIVILNIFKNILHYNKLYIFNYHPNVS